jgi:5,10-methenyltetrahydromethanopterin hydrogenase
VTDRTAAALASALPADAATGWAAAWADAASVIDTIDYVISANLNASPGELVPVIREIIRDWHDREPRPATEHTAEALALIHDHVEAGDE